MDYELIFWVVLSATILLALLFGKVLNLDFNPKADDPYRYCPKEEE